MSYLRARTFRPTNGTIFGCLGLWMLIGLVLVIVKLVAKLAWHNWPVTLIVVAAVVGLVVWRRLRHGEQNETVVNDSSE